ncbi:glycosyltransferase family 4 protein [Sagittula sp. SSi028]|uniref:glycosyltransferase family 4 protein n=1 Tax=Sagittula sp. SSi028 TaxID=3400636 RepID=UPI003AF85D8F
MKVVLTGNTTFKIANFREGLIKRLIHEGCTVYVLSPQDEYVSDIEKLGCIHVPIKISRSGTSPIAELKVLIKIFRVVRSIKPNVVLSYTIKNNIYIGLACSAYNTPFIPNITGLGPAFNGKGPFQIMIKCIYRAALLRAKTVFVQNTSDQSIIIKSKIATREQVKLLPGSGVDLDRYKYTTLRTGKSETIFILIARLLWDKGVKEYVNAAKTLKKMYPTSQFRILGPLDEDSKGSVGQRQLDQWLADGDIDYLGAQKEVYPFIQEADCVVLPSFYNEGTPRALLEAAATGRPVITTDMPGCRDVVLNQKSGYLVEPRSEASLVAAMKSFMELSNYERKLMSRESRKHVEEKYDEKHVINSYMLEIGTLK